MGAKKIDTFTQSSDHQGQNSVAVEFLSLAGFTLYGNEWIVPLAAELGISPSEIRNWLAGKTPLTMEAAIWPRVIEALRGREETLGRILGETRAAVVPPMKRRARRHRKPPTTRQAAAHFALTGVSDLLCR